MRRVLVPYDDSGSSQRALRLAMEDVSPSAPAEIHLLNVQEWPPMYGELLSSEELREFREQQLANGGKVLARAAEPLAARGIPHQTHVRIGSAELAIIDQAHRLCCDQIVMGTRGHSPIKGLVLGSVAGKVVHLADVPVTLVK